MEILTAHEQETVATLPADGKFYHWGEAFMKFGFEDGEHYKLSSVVAEKIRSLGFEVEQAGSTHNEWITKVTRPESDKDLWDDEDFCLWDWDEIESQIDRNDIEDVLNYLPDFLFEAIESDLGDVNFLIAESGDCSKHGGSAVNEIIVVPKDKLSLVKHFLKAQFEFNLASKTNTLFCDDNNDGRPAFYDTYQDAFFTLESCGVFSHKYHFRTTWNIGNKYDVLEQLEERLWDNLGLN
jgi:hypothetical protein